MTHFSRSPKFQRTIAAQGSNSRSGQRETSLSDAHHLCGREFRIVQWPTTCSESTELRPWANRALRRLHLPPTSACGSISLRCFARGPRRLVFELGLPLAVVVSRTGLMKRGARTGLNPRQPQSARASKAGRQLTTARCSLSWLQSLSVAFLRLIRCWRANWQDKGATGAPLTEDLSGPLDSSMRLTRALSCQVCLKPDAEFLDVSAPGECPGWRGRFDNGFAHSTQQGFVPRPSLGSQFMPGMHRKRSRIHISHSPVIR